MTTDLTTDVIPNPIPRKLNDAMIKALYTAIAAGNYPTTAAAICHVQDETFSAWLNLGRLHVSKGFESCYSRLFLRIKEAEAKAEVELVNTVRSVAVKDRNWIAAMTFLERRHPEKWGRKDRVQVDQNKTVSITTIVKHYPGDHQPAIEGQAVELPALDDGQ